MREKELQKISEKYEKLEAEKVELERLQIELCNRKEARSEELKTKRDEIETKKVMKLLTRSKPKAGRVLGIGLETTVRT